MKRKEIDEFVWNILLDSARRGIISHADSRNIHKMSLDINPLEVQRSSRRTKRNDPHWVTLFGALHEAVDTHGIINAAQMMQVLSRAQLYLTAKSQAECDQLDQEDERSAQKEAEQASWGDAMFLIISGGQPTN